MDKSELGMRLLTLGVVEPWVEERSMISLLLPEYFLDVIRIGLTR